MVTKCQACKEEQIDRPMVRHHWYEPPTFKKKQKMICKSCNTLLSDSRLKLCFHSHILPPWKLQCEFVQEYKHYRSWIENWGLAIAGTYRDSIQQVMQEATNICGNGATSIQWQHAIELAISRLYKTDISADGKSKQRDHRTWIL